MKKHYLLLALLIDFILVYFTLNYEPYNTIFAGGFWVICIPIFYFYLLLPLSKKRKIKKQEKMLLQQQNEYYDPTYLNTSTSSNSHAHNNGVIIGIRDVDINKSIKARTTGKMKREIKKATNPLYAKKGNGYITNPKRAVYNKVYKKTTKSAKSLFK